MGLLIFFTSSFLGWQLFKRFKFPAPTIMGPLVVVTVVNLLWMDMSVPELLRPVLSIVVGLFLGFRFRINVRDFLKPLLFFYFWMIVTANAAGFALYKMGLEKMTALFCAMPGGGSELAIAAMSTGADSFQVILFQSSRMVTLLVAMPLILRSRSDQESSEKTKKESNNGKPVSWLDWVFVIILAFLVGYLLNGIPAGNIIGAMLAAGVYTRLRNLNIKVHDTCQNFAITGIGGLIGLSVTKESIQAIPQLLLPIIMLSIFLIGSCLVVGYLLHKNTDWGLTTCLLATAPGGMTAMSMLAIQLEADAACVATFHAVRLIGVLLIAPLQAHLLEHFF